MLIFFCVAAANFKNIKLLRAAFQETPTFYVYWIKQHISFWLPYWIVILLELISSNNSCRYHSYGYAINQTKQKYKFYFSKSLICASMKSIKVRKKSKVQWPFCSHLFQIKFPLIPYDFHIFSQRFYEKLKRNILWIKQVKNSQSLLLPTIKATHCDLLFTVW